MSGRLKLRKLVQRPGEFVRDALVRRYPLPPSARAGGDPTIPAEPLGAHHEREPFAAAPTIDAVVTWVDGMDPAWLERKAGSAASSASATSDGPNRHVSHSELRYCLRSLHDHAPWVRCIYLVTDGQRPSWLRDHPKVVIVDHARIIPAAYRPTFNSHVIEAWLHAIPGLAEHFLYLNDDVMLSRDTPASHYVGSNGVARNFISTRRLPSVLLPGARIETDHGHANVRMLLERSHGVAPRYRMEHTVSALRRSTFEAAHELYGDAIDRACGNAVRARGDLPFTNGLIPHLAYLRGEASFERTFCVHIDTASGAADWQYDELLRRRHGPSAPYSICLDTNVQRPPTTTVDRMIGFLRRHFPNPAPWEADV